MCVQISRLLQVWITLLSFRRRHSATWGSFILNDDLYEANGDDKIPYLYTNVFAGKPPYEIITQLALDAGIPKKYLDTRIEKIMKVPFLKVPKTVLSILYGPTWNRESTCSTAEYVPSPKLSP